MNVIRISSLNRDYTLKAIVDKDGTRYFHYHHWDLGDFYVPIDHFQKKFKNKGELGNTYMIRYKMGKKFEFETAINDTAFFHYIAEITAKGGVLDCVTLNGNKIPITQYIQK